MNENKKLIVGLLGESTNDTKAIKNLLEKHFNTYIDGKQIERIECKVLLEREKREPSGSYADTTQYFNEAKSAYQIYKPDVVVFIRDLDQSRRDSNKTARRNEIQQRQFRMDKFEALQKALHAQAGHTDLPVYFLLIQYAFEALILADLEKVNQIWRTNLNLEGQKPIEVKNPAQWIKDRYPQYDEGSCPTLFKDLRLITIQDNHSDFSDFMEAFQPHLSAGGNNRLY